jgi:uncharacterized protein
MLSAADLAAVLRAEVSERRSAADGYAAAGRSEQAGRLRREADVLLAVLPGPQTAGWSAGGLSLRVSE